MILAPALLLAASAIQADPAGIPGSRKEAEQAMARFAMCEVGTERGRKAALAFTREVDGTPSDYPQRLIKSSCAPRGTTMRFKPELFRMALFPALYARDYGKWVPADLSAVPPLDHGKEFDGTPSNLTLLLRQFGDCVARRDPVNTRNLVLSRTFSQAEAVAVTALQPAMGQCVAPGENLRFSRSVVHGALGEALYKLTAASAATKAS
jgi:hypothetical protein